MRLKFMLFLLAGSLLILGCENSADVARRFEERALEIQRTFVPDPSLNIFQASLKLENGRWVVEGETTVPMARLAMLEFADSLLGASGRYSNRLQLLPDSALGDSTYGIVSVAVAHLREEPRHAAQLVDQSILGRTLRLLKKQGGWYLVQTEYGYLGWMRRESFQRSDRKGKESWEEKANLRVTALFSMVYSHPNESSEPVAEVVLNAPLAMAGKTGEWVKVDLPDQKKGFIRARDVAEASRQQLTRSELQEGIIRLAKRMTGIPYLWGGNSSLFSDCSGFTQTVFGAQRIALPRDARQQAEMGEEIVPDSDFSNVLPGDLLFFGSEDNITHVGISLGGMRYIHQSGQVHVNSFDPSDKLYSAYRRRTLRKIKRVF